jgi:electron transfer flavoprotein alpha subunit
MLCYKKKQLRSHFSALQGLPENYAPLLVENIKKGEFTHIVAGHSAFGKSLLPRVAALLDVQQISDITGIESEDSTYTDEES